MNTSVNTRYEMSEHTEDKHPDIQPLWKPFITRDCNGWECTECGAVVWED